MTRTLDAALHYATKLGPVFALAPNSKKPFAGSRGVIDATCDEQTIRAWWADEPRSNIGVSCAKLLLVDVDRYKPSGDAWLREHADRLRGLTITQLTARGGLHFAFTLPPDELRGVICEGVDLRRGPGHYFVGSPSVTRDGSYRWLRGCPSEPAAVPGWLIEQCRRPLPVAAVLPCARPRTDLFERARRYVSKCDPAISGAGGHRQAYVTCLRLVTRFPELSDSELFELLGEWNSRCSPPWSAGELEHKLHDALRSVRGVAA